MKRLTLLAALVVLLIGASAGAAQAVTDFDNAPSGAHYRQGYSEPVCQVNQTATAITVSCTGTQIGGVGNTNADLLLTVDATANFVCHNPGNDNIVEPHSGSATDSDSATLRPDKNGQLVVGPRSVTLSSQEAADQFTCPNRRWREEFVGFSDVSYTYSLTFAGFSEPAILITG